MGTSAGFFITTGSNNIAIGFDAQVPESDSSNQVRIGNTEITSATIQVPWTTSSDRRWKGNIEDADLGLGFINSLRPVSYVRHNDAHQKTEYGLIAQELEAALLAAGVHHSGMITRDQQGMLLVRYNDLLAPLIKSVQELKAENEALKTKTEALQGRVRVMEAQWSQLGAFRAEMEMLRQALLTEASTKK